MVNFTGCYRKEWEGYLVSQLTLSIQAGPEVIKQIMLNSTQHVFQMLIKTKMLNKR